MFAHLKMYVETFKVVDKDVHFQTILFYSAGTMLSCTLIICNN